MALHDQSSDTVTFPYEIDQGRRVHSKPLQLGEGLTSIVIRGGRPLRLGRRADQDALGAVSPPGTTAGESWLGVPIPSGQRVIGAVVLGNERPNAFDDSDQRLVSDRRRGDGRGAGERPPVRGDEAPARRDGPARSRAGAGQRDRRTRWRSSWTSDAIIELVGERLRSLFATRSLSIARYDDATNMHRVGLRGRGGTAAPQRGLRPGPGRHLPGDRDAPGRSGRDAGASSSSWGLVDLGGAVTESWLGVPIIAGDHVIGAVILESTQQHAFGEADSHLLTTIVSSMAVALENARLFGETKRLLAETEQRAAELALINEIGQALARHLDFDAIVELVGKRLRSIFRSQARDLGVGIYDRDAGTIAFPYFIDSGRRVRMAPMPLGTGLTSIVVERGRPLRLGTTAEQAATTTLSLAPGLSQTESWLGVPIPSGAEVIGAIIMGHPRANAFSESDERLVSTVAASMGVALQNARLFGETKRLLAETDQRAAELALVNEIGQALAKQLDFDAIVELVGERIRGLFEATTITLATLRPDDADHRFPVHRGRRRARLRPTPRAARAEGLNSTDHPARGGRCSSAWRRVGCRRGDHHRSVDRVVARRARSWPATTSSGSSSLESMRPDAFDERDERLLTTIVSSMGVALENARLLRRDEAPAGRDRPAGGRAGDHQRRPGGPRQQARDGRDVRAGRRQDPGDLRRPGRGHRHARPGGRADPLRVHHRARGALPQRGRSRSSVRGATSWRPASRCSSTGTRRLPCRRSASRAR